ncbi:transposase [Telmatocola sphagniphila]|uniref:Transposase n=1 Tax=Telmatocola sphagniphila TaxID=1123043 RepID=A0A8E6B5B6_9BACT|nr:transposase [Telmatocola sphagniphila]QVL31401.1 transposase [Telmatocola sphagniphila]
MSKRIAHRKTFERRHQPGDFHELTFSIYRRFPVLEGDYRLKQLARCIDAATEELRLQLVAFVFMPDHIHLLVFPLEKEPDLVGFQARFKRRFSRFVKENLIETGSPLLEKMIVRERPGKHCFRLWQEGPGYDRNLFTMEAVCNSIEYLHANPLRKGLCERATDWKWSSAKYYSQQSLEGLDGDLPKIHGLSKDWRGYELKGREFLLG